MSSLNNSPFIFYVLLCLVGRRCPQQWGTGWAELQDDGGSEEEEQRRGQSLGAPTLSVRWGERRRRRLRGGSKETDRPRQRLCNNNR